MSDPQTVSGAVAEVTSAPKMSSAVEELAAAQTCYDALKTVDPQTRWRITQWLSQRLNWEQNDHDEEPF